MNVNKIIFLAAVFFLSACQEKPNGMGGASLTPLSGTYVVGAPHQYRSMVFYPNGDLFIYNDDKKIGQHKYVVEQDRVLIDGHPRGIIVLNKDMISHPGYGEMKKNENK